MFGAPVRCVVSKLNACFRFPPGSSASAFPSSFTHGKAAPLVLRQTTAAGSGEGTWQNLLAHLLANYSIRGRMRPYRAKSRNRKILDFPHQTPPNQTKEY